ncbi:DNA-directed RNA polymerase specialized sigma subunit, sigma24 [Desulfosporosinus acidiphilus SJ4]|uniref:DNA-directed RNA polymerase specialized sigma subunit, sigma24 n=1 Tax=Desulfosporosinus acidiphilus (strain DSM 22704 / JCM 16185 / SJ4) TaxID=646529 RepID=I4D6R9_DESAJ|nr:sigma factor [Desulfosporosinus acidiphilus]AFM41493.1 DNA-directed RNA polymerase specialized sigma subunit, sigma24 [Desulfosporosinus acidiphilus SJ4]
MEYQIKKAQKGDKEAFVQAITLYLPVMYKVARTRLSSEEDIGDAIQESILSAFKNLQSLKNPSVFHTWLMRILINQCNGIGTKITKVTVDKSRLALSIKVKFRDVKAIKKTSNIHLDLLITDGKGTVISGEGYVNQSIGGYEENTDISNLNNGVLEYNVLLSSLDASIPQMLPTGFAIKFLVNSVDPITIETIKTQFIDSSGKTYQNSGAMSVERTEDNKSLVSMVFEVSQFDKIDSFKLLVKCLGEKEGIVTLVKDVR